MSMYDSTVMSSMFIFLLREKKKKKKTDFHLDQSGLLKFPKCKSVGEH